MVAPLNEPTFQEVLEGPPDLIGLVLAKCRQLGTNEAAKYFDVSQVAVRNWLALRSVPGIQHAQRILTDNPNATVAQPSIPEDLGDWEGRKILIATAAYSHVEPGHHLSLIAAMRNFGHDKVGYTQIEATLIDESRGALLRRFVKSQTATDMIMVDDDMLLPCGVPALMQKYGCTLPEPYLSMNFISRLMSHPRDTGIIGATYVGRHVHGKIQCSAGFESSLEDKYIRDHPDKGLKKVGWVATGCIRITREVAEKMLAEAPTKFPDTITKDGPNVFSKAAGMGEDVAFCRRAEKIGISSFIDTSLICGHIGKMTFWPSNTTWRKS